MDNYSHLIPYIVILFIALLLFILFKKYWGNNSKKIKTPASIIQDDNLSERSKLEIDEYYKEAYH